jgi:hypothetical protein
MGFFQRIGTAIKGAFSGAPPEQPQSARSKRLGALNDLYRGEQYANKGLAPPWDKLPPGRRNVPLRQQVPSTQYDLPRLIVDRPTALLFGEGRFPEICLEPQVAGQDVSLVNKWLGDIAEEGSLAHAALIWARQGAASGTAVMTWALVDGEFDFETHRAEFCQPTFDPKKRKRLVGLEKRYKFKKQQEQTSNGTVVIVEVDFWHREEWTVDEHVVYKDAPVNKDGSEPMWEIDDRSNNPVAGRLPGVWVKNIDPGDASQIDGISLLDGLADIIEDMDRTLSQKSRAVRYNQDPERAYFGMTPEQVATISTGGGTTSLLPAKPGGDLKLIEMNGEGQKIAEEHVVAQRGRVLETARVVSPEPERLIAAAQSGAAMRILFAAMLELVSELRQSYGVGLREILSQVLEAARTGALSSLGTLSTPVPDAIPAGKVKLQWGRYFDPTPDDLQKVSMAITNLVNSKVVDKETILRTFASFLGIKDIAHVLAKLDEELADDMAAEVAPLGNRKPPAPPSGEDDPSDDDEEGAA